MHVLMQCLCVLLCLCLVAAQAFDSTHVEHVELVVDCCSVLEQLYTFMEVEDEYKACNPVHCSSLKLMTLFLNHTSTILQTESVLSGPSSASLVLGGVRPQGSDLVFSLPTTGKQVAQLMVFTFFGRSVSPAENTNMQLWVKYDSKQNRVRFEDSSCDFNKNVYTTLVLSSIILLMFFIAVQVVVVEAAKRQTEEDAKDKTSVSGATVGFVSAKQTSDATNTRALTDNQRVSVHHAQLFFRHTPQVSNLRFNV
jgi:hypothetical protein